MSPLQTTIRKAAGLPDFQFELFPLHSPLLGESMFVSFPPLSNMLKFSGYSYFIRDLILIVPPAKRRLVFGFVSFFPFYDLFPSFCWLPHLKRNRFEKNNSYSGGRKYCHTSGKRKRPFDVFPSSSSLRPLVFLISLSISLSLKLCLCLLLFSFLSPHA